MLQTRPMPCLRPHASRGSGRSRRLAAPFVRAQLSTAESAKVEERAVQFMVDMACQSCVSKVKASLQGVQGISTVSADLSTQTVLVEGTATVEALLSAITTSGMNARLVGQGSVTGFGEELARSLGLDLRTLRQSLAAVSEFKGDAWGQGDVVGVVRFVQVNRALCRVEAALDGLTPGKHLLAVHTFGDMTAGSASTGPVLSAGILGTLVADDRGRAELVLMLPESIPVWDLIGRALVVYDGHTGQQQGAPAVAAVIARSAVAGDNTKKICACDGTLIWDSGDLIPRPPKRA